MAFAILAAITASLFSVHRAISADTPHWSRSDLDYLECSNAAAPIRISVPDTFKVNGCGDTISVIHPNAISFDQPFGGYRLWSVFSMMSDLKCDENTFLRVSNDGRNWIPLPGCPDPMSFKSDFVDSTQGTPPRFVGSSYASDPVLVSGADGRLWVITRAFFETGGNKAALFARSSTDGITWSANRRITPFVRGDAALLSPAIFPDSAGGYVMWSVSYNHETGGIERGRIEIRKAAQIDGDWQLVDTVRQAGSQALFPAGADTGTTDDDSIGPGDYTPWHLGVIANGGGSYLVILTAKNGGAVDPQHPMYLDFIGLTAGGRSLDVRSRPLLRPSYISRAPDSMYVYKATGWTECTDGVWTLSILYSGKGTRYWHTARTRAEVRRPAGVPDSSAIFITHRR